MKQEFEGLHKKLKNLSFPNLYLFKFILNADLEKIDKVESLFNLNKAKIRKKMSSNGSYISISVYEIMISPNEIIRIYEKSSKINGVIAL
tara:strand:+ start:91 stop:360 length:270 start_codon:yes stop_codon:yes gene_type:complete